MIIACLCAAIECLQGFGGFFRNSQLRDWFCECDCFQSIFDWMAPLFLCDNLCGKERLPWDAFNFAIIQMDGLFWKRLIECYIASTMHMCRLHALRDLIAVTLANKRDSSELQRGWTSYSVWIKSLLQPRSRSVFLFRSFSPSHLSTFILITVTAPKASPPMLASLNEQILFVESTEWVAIFY